MTTATPPGLYHERQRRLCCGVHSLNCLFQQPWVDAAALDRLATRVAAEQAQGGGDGAGAFRSWIPRLGSYDISVLIAALQEGQGARLSQHLLANAALGAELAALKEALLRQEQAQQQRQQQRIQGVLVNIRSRNPLNRWLLDGRHWLALVRSPANGLWYDLDSKLARPEPLGDGDAMLRYVRRCVEEEDGQAFVVEVEEARQSEQGQE